MADNLTPEQQQALAIAAARLRLQQQTAPATPSNPAVTAAQQAYTDALRSGDYTAAAKAGAALNSGDFRSDAEKLNASVGNAGRMARDVAIQGVPAAAGAFLGGPAGAMAGAAAGNAADQFLRMKLGEQQKFMPGQMAGAAIAAPFLGGGLAGATEGQMVRAGSKMAAGNLLGETARTRIDEQRNPTAGEAALAVGGGMIGGRLGAATDAGTRAAEIAAKTGGTELKQTLAAMKELGYVTPPSLVHPTIASDALESFAGVAKAVGKANEINQPATTNAVRTQLGLPLQTIKPEVSAAELNALDLIANKPYAAVDAIAPAELKGFKDAQSAANALFSQNRNDYKAATLEAARKAQAEADGWLAAIKNKVPSDMFDELQAARIKKAEIALARDAVNKGTGAIDASVIGKALDQGMKLTGNYEKIGRVQQAFERLLKEKSKAVPVGVSQLGATLGSMGALGGYAAGQSQGAVLGGAVGAMAGMAAPMVVPRMARSIMYSPAYQSAIQSAATRAPESPDFQSVLARFLTQGATQQAARPNVQQFAPQGTR